MGGKPELQVRLGEVIRSRRSKSGLSQEAFADVVGLHRTYIGAIERGERNVSLFNLERLAAALGVKLSLLIAEAEQPREHRRG